MPKSVLVVEDERTVSRSLAKSLKQFGFKADIAKDLNEARTLLKKSHDPYDVAVLDILIEDPTNPHATGLDLGREIREAQPELPPEIVIFSGKYRIEHYNEAVGLAVSEFIKKDDPTSTTTNIVPRIGTWALRRSLSPLRIEIGQKIEQIAEQDLDTTTAIKHLCTEVIKPEIEASLRVPVLFLLSDRHGTQNVMAQRGLPEGYDVAYKRIQDAVFSQNGPFTFHKDVLKNTDTAPELHSRLMGSSFINLHEEGDLRLSIGILKLDWEDNFAAAKDPQKLTALLKDRFRPPVIKLLRYLGRIEAAVERTERKTLLEHTSRFCMYVGQTQLDVLAEAVQNEEIDPSNKCFQKLHRLAKDLNATGNEFSQLSFSRTSEQANRNLSTSARSVVEKSWEMVKEQYLVDQLDIQHQGDDVQLPIAEPDLLVAVLRLLQWMAQRQDKMPGDVPDPRIEVTYSNRAGHLEIELTDQSRRLSAPLRRKLFEPFTLSGSITETRNADGDREQLNGLYLPLYLAKTVIEVKNNGALEDKTDEMERKLGHCFTISFPLPEEVKT